VVPETDDPIPALGEPGAATTIVGGRVVTGVPAAVDFENEPRRRTEEVDHPGTDRHLSTKADPEEAMAAQQSPQTSFRLGHRATQTSGGGSRGR
jgi:hypothetical protein